MKKFLAIYTGSASSEAMKQWYQLSEEDRNAREKAGMEAWGKWLESKQGQIVDVGTPLGKTKRISKKGIEDIKNQMAAYAIVLAESHEAAAKLFENHPHFSIFPGEAVEVMECLPLPRD